MGDQDSGVGWDKSSEWLFLGQLTGDLQSCSAFRTCENTEVSACRKSEFLLLESVETWKCLEI